MKSEAKASARASIGPLLARTWYAAGPERSYHQLADQFARLGEQGRLDTPDPLPAGRHFLWLVLSVPLNRAMFDDEPCPVEELHRFADTAVDAFLKLYGV